MFHILNFMLNGQKIVFVQTQWSKIVSILSSVYKTDHPHPMDKHVFVHIYIRSTIIVGECYL